MTVNQICRTVAVAAAAYLIWSTVVSRIPVEYVWPSTITLQVILILALVYTFYCTRPQRRHARYPSTVSARIRAIRAQHRGQKEYLEGQ